MDIESQIELQESNYGTRRRIRDALFSIPGYIYTSLNIPGFIRPIDYFDKISGNRICIRLDRRFTIISVNHRDYWFRRISGKFDGTGYSMCNPTIEEQLCCISGDIPESSHPLSLWGRLKLKMQSIGWGCSA